MHVVVWVRHLIVHVLILVANTVVVVHVHIIEDCVVVVDEGSSVQVLRQEVESHIVPVGWLDLVLGEVLVPPVVWEWQMDDLGVEHRHFSFEELILTSIVRSVPVGHADSRSVEHGSGC